MKGKKLEFFTVSAIYNQQNKNTMAILLVTGSPPRDNQKTQAPKIKLNTYMEGLY